MLSNKHINKFIYAVTAVCLSLIMAVVVIAVGSDISFASGKAEYTDLIFDSSKIIDINIIADEEDWQGMLDNAISEEYISVDIVVNGETYKSVGIRPKGNSSLSSVAGMQDSDRYSFKVKFDEYINGQTLHGLSKIALNNIISDSTYMKEYLSYGLFELMEVPSPNFAYANIKLNGEDWGFYLAVETLEESFVDRVYGSLAGNLYKPESMNMGRVERNANEEEDSEFRNNNRGGFPQMMEAPRAEDAPNQNLQPAAQKEARPNDEGGVNEMAMPNDTIIPNNNGNANMPAGNPTGRRTFGKGMNGSAGGSNLVWTDNEISSYSSIFDNTVLSKTTTSDYKKVIDMIRNLNEGTDLEKYIDIEEVLRYFAVETFLVNQDSYESSMKHNYYLYEENGVFQMLPWDYNLAFGAFQVGDASRVINFPIDTPVSDSMENSPMVSKLLEVPEYKELYHSYLQKIIDEYVNSGLAEKIIYETDKLINSYVKNDISKFYTYDQYTAALPMLVTYCNDRAASIQAQLNGEQPSETYGNIPTTVDLNALGTQGGANFAIRMNNGGSQEGDFVFDGIMPMQNENINFDTLPLIMEIIQGSTAETITQYQKERLRELGLSDEDIEEAFTMINSSSRSNRNPNGRQMPNDRPMQGNIQNIQSGNNINSTTEDRKISDYYIEIISLIILAAGTIFALTFKRRRARA